MITVGMWSLSLPRVNNSSHGVWITGGDAKWYVSHPPVLSHVTLCCPSCLFLMCLWSLSRFNDCVFFFLNLVFRDFLPQNLLSVTVAFLEWLFCVFLFLYHFCNFCLLCIFGKNKCFHTYLRKPYQKSWMQIWSRWCRRCADMLHYTSGMQSAKVRLQETL